jgi:hypothetical protein
MRFILLLSLIATAALATDYAAKSTSELTSGIEDLTVMCLNNHLYIHISRYVDPVPWTGIGPLSAAIVEISPMEATRTVLIVCGTRARDFYATDVCIQFMRDACSGKTQYASSTRILILPFLNERSRDLIFYTWPEARGSYERSYGKLLYILPDYLHRTAVELFDGEGTLAQTKILPRMQCFDGSVRLTDLAQNYPVSWQRDSTNIVQIDPSSPFFVNHLRTSSDILSGNGRVPFSDPETRIVKTIIELMSVDVVIDVTMGTEGILSPIESPVRAADRAGIPPHIRENIDASTERAIHIAKTSCPVASCINGGAAQARNGKETHRTGTLVDYAIFYGVPRAYVVQVLSLNQTNSMDKLSDCLLPYLPQSIEVAEKLVPLWSVVIDKLIAPK